MEFTTHLALHSQATRLGGSRHCFVPCRDGIATLSDPPFKGEFLHATRWPYPCRLQFGVDTDLHVELFPVHSPLLGESLLVSFPPLSYMLKFRGYSYLISGQKLKWIGGRQRGGTPFKGHRQHTPETTHQSPRHCTSTHAKQGHAGVF